MIVELNESLSRAAVEARCAHIYACILQNADIRNAGLCFFTLFLRDRPDMILAHLALLVSCTAPFVLTSSRSLRIDFPMEYLEYLHKLGINIRYQFFVEGWSIMDWKNFGSSIFKYQIFKIYLFGFKTEYLFC
jgi:hypothetical protein